MTTPDLKALREALGRLRRSVDMDPSWSKRSPVYWGDVVTAICEGERLMKENTALLARLSAAERDAGRYRWAREQCGYAAWNQSDHVTVSMGVTLPKRPGTCNATVTPELIDAAIDAARQDTQP